MAAVLDGSVGVIRPGSWWRTGGGIANYTGDQLSLISLLAAIPEADGGKREYWAYSLPPAASDGICATHLADAIWDFQQFWKAKGTFRNIDGVVDPVGGSINKMNELAGGAPPPKPGPPAEFIVHDVRLFGWQPNGDSIEVNGDTPLRWMLDTTIERGRPHGGNLVLKIMSHGLPGFVQCCRGALTHPTLPPRIMDGARNIGPGKSGISRFDFDAFRTLAGHVRRIEFHSCLVARMGTCPEANGHACYDGNLFCSNLAQVTRAEIVASIHIQNYWYGTGPNAGMSFGNWNGTVFTWGPGGNVTQMQQWTFEEKYGPPRPV